MAVLEAAQKTFGPSAKGRGFQRVFVCAGTKCPATTAGRHFNLQAGELR